MYTYINQDAVESLYNISIVIRTIAIILVIIILAIYFYTYILNKNKNKEERWSKDL